jgi:hypothetical protein
MEHAEDLINKNVQANTAGGRRVTHYLKNDKYTSKTKYDMFRHFSEVICPQSTPLNG